MIHFLSRFHGDQKGATLAEFVLTLPIFIMCFVGIVQLGLWSEKSVKVWAKAHRITFAQATLVNQSRFSLQHMQPQAAGAVSLGQLAFGNKPLNQSGIQRGLILAAEGTTYGDMALRGHWGESSTRTLPVDLVVQMKPPLEGMRTRNSADILGGSALSRDLLNDTANFSGSAGGALGVINQFLSGSGTRAALAAGQRYGTVIGWSSDSMTVAGRTVSMRAHFNSLVPPFPLTGTEAQFLPMAITRVTMENHRAYSQILGINWSQPYPGGSISVQEKFPAEQ
ncbi:pilus assembly protein [Microvenator marinus]|uniref:Pilus assembly protein n=1 Tax=Microvenator marinus TaxID=2600177 RepID=A0A5B8XUI3_9DELT|nr:TadE family protein [Microvenator marinus]QED27059.1 pilus assembly protein [Microvenator marinus]